MMDLKCYSQILCGRLPKILDFGCFVLIWWQTATNQQIKKILKAILRDVMGEENFYLSLFSLYIHVMTLVVTVL